MIAVALPLAAAIAGGLLLGAVTAWSQAGWRVFLRTAGLAAVVVLAVMLAPAGARWRASPFLLVGAIAVASSMALAGDYLAGLVLHRNDKRGYRHDSVGH
ncbi:MAG: hypothetical protein KGJ62_08875 [Armatimonadetes bacterium]|nr:hypothetical protein [Armatimonadota bacterium]MDE2207704.1 hypothetical protein [Armatimonadota bacterium]